VLHCIIVYGRMSELGQSATPTFANVMEELARRPDANDVNCWHAGAPVRGRFITPAAVVPQIPAIAGDHGFGLGP
jgi:hypothetical protein